MAVVEACADCAESRIDVFGHGVHIINASTFLCNCAPCLVYQDRACQTATANKGSLLSSDCYVVVHLAYTRQHATRWSMLDAYNGHLDRMIGIGNSALLEGKSEQEHISRVTLHDKYGT